MRTDRRAFNTQTVEVKIQKMISQTNWITFRKPKRSTRMRQLERRIGDERDLWMDKSLTWNWRALVSVVLLTSFWGEWVLSFEYVFWFLRVFFFVRL